MSDSGLPAGRASAHAMLPPGARGDDIPQSLRHLAADKRSLPARAGARHGHRTGPVLLLRERPGHDRRQRGHAAARVHALGVQRRRRRRAVHAEQSGQDRGRALPGHGAAAEPLLRLRHHAGGERLRDIRGGHRHRAQHGPRRGGHRHGRGGRADIQLAPPALAATRLERLLRAAVAARRAHGRARGRADVHRRALAHRAEDVLRQQGLRACRPRGPYEPRGGALLRRDARNHAPRAGDRPAVRGRGAPAPLRVRRHGRPVRERVPCVLHLQNGAGAAQHVLAGP
ncbi:PP258 [Orf virus]|uniref:PP258 n=1 Tax=Orf virus TaxID=10258 RepID=F1AXF2_ORFV|nr:PP258 [Orf virus]